MYNTLTSGAADVGYTHVMSSYNENKCVSIYMFIFVSNLNTVYNHNALLVLI